MKTLKNTITLLFISLLLGLCNIAMGQGSNTLRKLTVTSNFKYDAKNPANGYFLKSIDFDGNAIWDSTVVKKDSVFFVVSSGLYRSFFLMTDTANFFGLDNQNYSSNFAALIDSDNGKIKSAVFSVDSLKSSSLYVPIDSGIQFSYQNNNIGASYTFPRDTGSVGQSLSVFFNDGSTSTSLGWKNTPAISTGTSAPATTPAQIGDLYIDTSNRKLYFAVGTASAADWEIAN
jgi:hypothetical protein